MVRGDRDAKRAARQRQAVTGEPYSVARRKAGAGSVAQSCSWQLGCGNMTRDPSGRCHHHQGRAPIPRDGLDQARATIGTTPPSAVQTLVYDMEELPSFYRRDSHGNLGPMSEFNNLSSELGDDDWLSRSMALAELNRVASLHPYEVSAEFVNGPPGTGSQPPYRVRIGDDARWYDLAAAVVEVIRTGRHEPNYVMDDSDEMERCQSIGSLCLEDGLISPPGICAGILAVVAISRPLAPSRYPPYAGTGVRGSGAPPSRLLPPVPVRG